MQRFFSFLAFASLATAVRAPAASLTITAQKRYPPPASMPTASFDDEYHAAVRRDTTTTTTTSFTSYAPASVCGWSEGLVIAPISCSSNYECVFHPPNSAWPGLKGCCEAGNTNNCEFYTTCYDSSDISASPTLLDGSDSSFTLFCSGSASPDCFTYGYPDLTVTDYGCFESGLPMRSAAVSTRALASTMGSLVSTDSITYISMVSVLYASDSWIDIAAGENITTSAPTSSVLSTSASSSSSSSSSSPPSTSPSSPQTPSSASSRAVGALIGIVLSVFVVVVAGVVICCLLWRRIMRNRRLENVDKGSSNQGPSYKVIPQGFTGPTWTDIPEADGEEVRNPNYISAELDSHPLQNLSELSGGNLARSAEHSTDVNQK